MRSSMACVRPSSSCPCPTRSSGQASPGAPGPEGERKLGAYKRQNRLDFALAEVGRIERTLFTLDWLESPALRRACQAGLNKGEARHALAQAVYAHRQGQFADRTIE